MTNDRSTSPLFSPLFAWFDLGMRAAEMTVASSQNINDAVDRIARAGASVQSDETGATSFVAWDAPVARVPATLGRVGDFHRRIFELTTESWVRWMSALGTVASLPAGVGLARTVARRDNPLEAVRTSLRPSTWGEKPATERHVGSLTYPSQQRRRDSTLDMQHALADEGKARRKTTAKHKRAPRSGRRSARSR
jgi:hypothetical protein